MPEAANFHKPTAQTKLGVDFVDGGGLVRVRAVAAGFPAADLFPGDVVDAINANRRTPRWPRAPGAARRRRHRHRAPPAAAGGGAEAGVYDKLGADFVDAPGLGVVVGNVFPGFPLAATAQVFAGDQLLTINGALFASAAAALAMLQGGVGQIVLAVRRLPPAGAHR